MSRSSINIFVPPISSFPELSPLDIGGGGSYARKDRIHTWPNAKPMPSAAQVAPVAAGPGGGAVPEDNIIFLMDGKGHMLDSLHYPAEDYRVVLMDSFGQDSSASKPNLTKEQPSTSRMQ